MSAPLYLLSTHTCKAFLSHLSTACCIQAPKHSYTCNVNNDISTYTNTMTRQNYTHVSVQASNELLEHLWSLWLTGTDNYFLPDINTGCKKRDPTHQINNLPNCTIPYLKF